MPAFERLIKLAAPVIIFLNTLGPIISGIWLIVLGEWKLVIVSFLVTAFFAAKLIGLALLPQIAIIAPALYFAKQLNRILTYFFVALSHLYAAALMVGWSVLALYYFVPANVLHSFNTAAPHLIWAYGIAVSPWTYIAMHESGNNDSLAPIFCFFIQIGFIAAIIAILLFNNSLIVGGYLILGTMLIAVGVIIPFAGHQMLVAGASEALDEKINKIRG